MLDVSLKPIIENMVWSFSRVKAFEFCPYSWYLRYILKYRPKDLFFSMQHAQGEYISLNFDGNHVLYEEAKQAIPQIPY